MAITAFSARLAERWQPDRWAGLSQRALGLQWTYAMIYGCLVNLSPPERPSPKRNSRGSLWRWITSMLRRWTSPPSARLVNPRRRVAHVT